VGQVSQLEDQKTRHEDDPSLPEFGIGTYASLSAEAKAKALAAAQKAKAEKDALRRAKAVNENEKLRQQIEALRADLARSKQKFGKLFYENKLMKAELSRAERETSFRLSWDATKVVRAGKVKTR
jgi:hypothetical protein